MKKDYLYQIYKIDPQKEKLIKEYIVHNANIVCFEEFHWTKIGFLYLKKFGGAKDAKFIETLNRLKKYQIKIDINKIRNDRNIYGHSQAKLKNDQYHCYKLSDEISKNYLREHVFSTYYDSFYGFIYPIFYKNDKLVANVINHENIVFLYSLDEKQVKYFSNYDIKLERIN